MNNADVEAYLTHLGFALVSCNDFTYVLIRICDIDEDDLDVTKTFEVPTDFLKAVSPIVADVAEQRLHNLLVLGKR